MDLHVGVEESDLSEFVRTPLFDCEFGTGTNDETIFVLTRETNECRNGPKKYIFFIDKINSSNSAVVRRRRGIARGGGVCGGSFYFKEKDTATRADVFSILIDNAGSYG